LTYHEKKRPYIILKWAESADGLIAPSPERRKSGRAPHWISGVSARQLVHKWRSEEHAVLVGSNTVLDDNPQLNLRLWSGSPPIRVVVDRELKIKDDFHIMDGRIKTIVITEVKDKSRYMKQVHYEALNFSGELAPQICQILHKQNIISLIIEGGARTLQTFIDANLWDEARVFISASPLGNGLMAPTFKGCLKACKKMGSDHLNLYAND
jgi:diaminohydroxyphosphoribosylaminopyrimidine deaminase/5-amino-6-(5-phosphoribosylamino)uracil reductase